MLVHHADAHVNCIQAGAEIYRISSDNDFTFIRQVFTEKNFHQSRLASPILTKDGMNFTCFDVKIHAIIGDDTWKAFRDATRF